MLDYSLSKWEIAELRAAHRRALNAREAYRINAGILLAQGRTAMDVAEARLIDPDTVAQLLQALPARGYRTVAADELCRQRGAA
jgi:muconolactone delta-isomerase